MEGKLYVFEVVARDEGGEVGKATHKRAIVESPLLEVGAIKQASAA
jgi:predicted thioesterase